MGKKGGKYILKIPPPAFPDRNSTYCPEGCTSSDRKSNRGTGKSLGRYGKAGGKFYTWWECTKCKKEYDRRCLTTLVNEDLNDQKEC